MINNTFEYADIVFSSPTPNRVWNENEVKEWNESTDRYFKEMDELNRKDFKGRPIKRFLYWLKYGE